MICVVDDFDVEMYAGCERLRHHESGNRIADGQLASRVSVNERLTLVLV